MPLDVLATIQFGGFINPWKLAAPLILLIIWAKLLAWIDKDSPNAHLPREIINCCEIVGLILGYLLFIMLPFGAAMGALFGMFVLDIGGYLGVRAKAVGLSDLREEFSKWLHGLLKGKKKEIKAAAGQI